MCQNFLRHLHHWILSKSFKTFKKTAIVYNTYKAFFILKIIYLLRFYINFPASPEKQPRKVKMKQNSAPAHVLISDKIYFKNIKFMPEI